MYKKIILVNNTIKIKGGIILKRLIIFLIMLLIFLASIGIGYFYLNTRDDQKNASKSEDLIAENNIENQTISTENQEEKISPNCRLTLKRYYTECQHTINEYIDISQSLVNATKKDLEKEYSNWEVKEYSSTEIVLYREFDSDCGQHFILKNDNGKITVYRINENNEEIEYQKTEISIDYLTETDKVQIQNGIRVNGIEELNQLIEDFE